MSYRPICDVWILARPKVKYYGAYPNGFLERARVLLGAGPTDPVLHVCGGHARSYPCPGRGFGRLDQTLDLDPTCRPDFVQSATDSLPRRDWRAMLADPPYTRDDAAHYGPGAAEFPSPNLILKRMLEAVPIGRRVGMLHYVLPQPPREGVKFIACIGGRVGMLHYILPQPPREGAKFVACVGVICGYNNRMRCFSVFERTT